MQANVYSYTVIILLVLGCTFCSLYEHRVKYFRKSGVDNEAFVSVNYDRGKYQLSVEQDIFVIIEHTCYLAMVGTSN